MFSFAEKSISLTSKSDGGFNIVNQANDPYGNTIENVALSFFSRPI